MAQLLVCAGPAALIMEHHSDHHDLHPKSKLRVGPQQGQYSHV